MKRSRFTEVQVAYALRQAEAGMPVVDVCRSLGISEATFYIWKMKYGDLGASEVRRLRQLEEENVRLKRVVADLTPTRRREMVQWIIDMCKVSVERACRLGNFSRGC